MAQRGIAAVMILLSVAMLPVLAERFGFDQSHLKVVIAADEGSKQKDESPESKTSKVQEKAGDSSTPTKKPFFGVGFVDETLKISEVEPGGPAEKAGLKPGDEVVRFDGVKIESRSEFTKALQQHKPGDKVSLVVQRGTGIMTITVQIAERPKKSEALKEVQIAAPTRIDWKFVAARAFGSDPDNEDTNDYDPRKQRYLLHVPKNYDASKAWPLIVFISPQDDPIAWQWWQKSFQDLGMFYCEAYAAGNDCPVVRRTRIVLDMLDDVRRHYHIDPDQTYLTGFSGGGRMSCHIAYALPEYFGGVMPICGTWSLPELTYLRHRVRDRLSVAFITGTGDFNRRENENYMAPWFRGLGIRSKLWLVKGMGHTIPNSTVLTEALKWLAADLPRRQADAKDHPGLAIKPGEAPTPEEQAARQLEDACAEAKQPEHLWRAAALAEGIVDRWDETSSVEPARKFLQEFRRNPRQAQLLDEQRRADKKLEASAKAQVKENLNFRPAQKPDPFQLSTSLQKLVEDGLESGDPQDTQIALRTIDKEIAKYARQERRLAIPKMRLLLSKGGDVEKAVQYGTKLTRITYKDDVRFLKELARALIELDSDEKPDVKVLQLARETALRADELAKEKDSDIADILARAYFLSGDSAKAVATQERAVQLATEFSEGQKAKKHLEELKKRLEEYKKK